MARRVVLPENGLETSAVAATSRLSAGDDESEAGGSSGGETAFLEGVADPDPVSRGGSRRAGGAADAAGKGRRWAVRCWAWGGVVRGWAGAGCELGHFTGGPPPGIVSVRFFLGGPGGLLGGGRGLRTGAETESKAVAEEVVEVPVHLVQGNRGGRGGGSGAVAAPPPTSRLQQRAAQGDGGVRGGVAVGAVPWGGVGVSGVVGFCLQQALDGDLGGEHELWGGGVQYGWGGREGGDSKKEGEEV